MGEEDSVKRGHGRWSEKGIPHKGWECKGVDDLEEPSMTCEMCQTSMIRFAHRMVHPLFDGELRVGAVCAGHMSEDLQGAKTRETALKNHIKRRVNWLTRKWRISKNGNPFIKCDGYIVIVFGKGNAWGCSVTKEISKEKVTLRGVYATCDDAKLAGFDFINQ